MESQFTFRYPDGDRKWSHVSVSGSFNDWALDATPLAFDPVSCCWIRDVKFSVSPLTKLMYKYVLDGTQWVCDDTSKEPDASGNVNNIAYTQLINNNLDSVPALDEEEPLDTTIEVTGIKSSPNSSSTTLSNLPEEHADDEPKLEITNADNKTIKNPKTEIKTPVVDEANPKLSIWQYIKWIFEFYILSLFSSTTTE